MTNEIWLKGEHDQVLPQLATILQIDEITMVQKILDHLIELEMTEDSVTDCGIWLTEIFDREKLTANGFVRGLMKNKLDFDRRSRAVIMIQKLKLFHMINDCDECGCDCEHESDGGWGKTWTISTCTNCGHRVSDEPDFPEYVPKFER